MRTVPWDVAFCTHAVKKILILCERSSSEHVARVERIKSTEKFSNES